MPSSTSSPSPTPTLTMNFFRSKSVALPKHNCVQDHALKTPAVKKLVGKRVILASNSPRRKDILKTFVSTMFPC